MAGAGPGQGRGRLLGREGGSWKTSWKTLYYRLDASGLTNKGPRAIRPYAKKTSIQWTFFPFEQDRLTFRSSPSYFVLT